MVFVTKLAETNSIIMLLIPSVLTTGLNVSLIFVSKSRFSDGEWM